jgi:hypothetical protein
MAFFLPSATPQKQGVRIDAENMNCENTSHGVNQTPPSKTTQKSNVEVYMFFALVT